MYYWGINRVGLWFMVSGGWACIRVTGGLVKVLTDSDCGSWLTEDGYVFMLLEG